MFQSKISKQEIDALPVGYFEGEISLVDSKDKLDEALQYLYTQRVLGFDTESRPSFRKGQKNEVSLLQLASDERAFLFRLNILGLPSSLKRLLAEPGILKVGLAIHDDLARLNGLGNFHPASFIDLQKLVGGYGIEDRGLRKLAAIVLGIKVSKSQQLSNWEGAELSTAQMRYAATDAWVCYTMYRRLVYRK